MAFGLLGRHVAGSPHCQAAPRERAGGTGACNPETQPLHPRTAFQDHDVSRLHVTVHDVALMRIVQRLAYLDHVMDFGKKTEMDARCYQLVEGHSFDIFHRDVRSLAMVAIVMHYHDVGML